MEKKADPPAKVFAPPEDITQDTGGTTRGLVDDTARTIANNLRSSATVGIPSEFDEDSKERLWDVQFMDVPDRTELFMSVLMYFTVKKLRAMVIPERVLTQDKSTGSFAMSKSQTDTWRTSLRLGLFRRCLYDDRGAALECIELSLQFGPAGSGRPSAFLDQFLHAGAHLLLQFLARLGGQQYRNRSTDHSTRQRADQKTDSLSHLPYLLRYLNV